MLATAPVCTGQRKNKVGQKQNGGSPYYLKMTSFEEIFRVADGKKVPDPFVNTKKIILQMCCVKVKPFELNTEANEAVVCSTRTLSSFNLLLGFTLEPK